MANNMERNRRSTFNNTELTDIGVQFLGSYRYLRPMPALIPHEHGAATEICYLEKGSQTYSVGGHDYRINGGEVFISFPRELHSTGESNQSRGCLYWVQVDADCRKLFGLPEDDAELVSECIRSLNARTFKVSDETGRLLISAYGDIASGSPLRFISARSKLVLFIFGLVTDMAAYGLDGDMSAEIKRCLAEIDEGARGELTTTALAASLNYSESYFKQKFKREVGIPPREYILRRKIELSKPELLDLANTVTDTALEFGFSSSQHYSRVFRDVTGMSPSEFIRSEVH
jgi:AraC-type DNA-binding domain-containing proteins